MGKIKCLVMFSNDLYASPYSSLDEVKEDIDEEDDVIYETEEAILTYNKETELYTHFWDNERVNDNYSERIRKW